MKVVHLAAFHPATDVRVFEKQCVCLASAGHDVHLVAPGPAPASLRGVRFTSLDVPKDGPLLSRLRGVRRAADAVLRTLEGDVLHFHETQMIPLALRHRRRFRKLIYDVHEDAPDDVAATLRNLGRPVHAHAARWLYRRWESQAKQACAGFVCATEHIARKFPPQRTVVVRNYPRLEEFGDLSARGTPHHDRPPRCVYAGNLTPNRGARTMVDAVAALNGPETPTFAVAGKILPPNLRDELMRSPGGSRLEMRGWLDRSGLVKLYGQSRVGLVVLDPLPGFQVALPIKLFEYMAAGLPVIASDFPLWRQIIESAGCGLLVPPQDPRALASAIERILSDPDAGEAMGQRGRQAVRSSYTWQSQQKTLLELYERLSRDA